MPLFNFFCCTGHLLVIGGSSAFADSVELIQFKNSTAYCQHTIPTFPYLSRGQASVLLQDKIPAICGGRDFVTNNINLDCHLLINNQWTSGPSLTKVRDPATAISVDNVSWLVSGADHNMDWLFLNGSTTSGPTMPMTDFFLCSIKINSTTAIFSMASLDDTTTYYYSIPEQSWVQGPSSKIGTHTTACGLLEDKVNTGVKYVVRAGGQTADTKQTSASTELLKVGTNEWIRGPDLPAKIEAASMASSLDGKSLILSGGHSAIPNQQPRSKLYRLQCVNGNCQWHELALTMKTDRTEHTSIFVPESHFPCN